MDDIGKVWHETSTNYLIRHYVGRTGRIDGQVHTGTDIFSIPAGKLIVEEAGGKVTDFSGENWDLKSKSVLATNEKVHIEIIKALRDA